MLRNFERRVGPIAAVVAATIIAVGSYAQFALPYYSGGPAGCHFSDALIVFISCDASVPGLVEGILEWSWYLTWGWFWLAAFFVPFVPLFGLPALGLWIVTIVFAIRWVWRQRPWRARD
ncbi:MULTISPECIES: hypothetical protein [unclassified Brevundimonas]|uniref:hypothetical protein n=1 Tax=unclassified Brevundimonas TaxID=2622653 RepID=UPI0025C734C0|nr:MULTISPECIES: hypothetical protein [unclassified Brevundimonas]